MRIVVAIINTIFSEIIMLLWRLWGASVVERSTRRFFGCLAYMIFIFFLEFIFYTPCQPVTAHKDSITSLSVLFGVCWLHLFHPLSERFMRGARASLFHQRVRAAISPSIFSVKQARVIRGKYPLYIRIRRSDMRGYYASS